MKVEIPFQEMWRDKMVNGEKICTTRTKRYGKKGDTFEAFDLTFVLTLVLPATLRSVADNRYVAEGCRSAQEFVSIWRRLHPRKGWVPEQRVQVHWFARLYTETVTVEPYVSIQPQEAVA